MITVEPTKKPGEHRNIDVSISIVRALSLLLGSIKLIITISKTRIIKTSVMRSIKGMSGNVPFVHIGRNLKMVERGMVKIADTSAAVDVARFQKKPKRKTDSTPGEIKPT